MKNTTNLLILNLAVADLLFLLVWVLHTRYLHYIYISTIYTISRSASLAPQATTSSQTGHSASSGAGQTVAV